MIRPRTITLTSSTVRYVLTPAEVRAAARQRRATRWWLAFAGACFAVAAGMLVAWGLS